MIARITEDHLEQQCLEWFQDIGYTHVFAPQLDSDGSTPERSHYRQVILAARLRRALERLNPGIAATAIESALLQLSNPNLPGLLAANRQMHRWLTQGLPITVMEAGEQRGIRLKLVDFDDPRANDWLVVNQLAVQGSKFNRRPDVVVYVNGLPLAVLELKNPAEPKADIWAAYNQLQTYKTDIPDLFIANVLLVISDGVNARVGSLSADRERFQQWRVIDQEQELDPLGKHRELETLVRGVFDPRRFLDFLHFFCLFEEDGRIIKKIAACHQFHAVRAAVERVVQASRPSGDRKGGVVWHTQGAGKSIEMACLAGMLLLDPRLGNPTLVIVTDRQDLDGQLFGVFAIKYGLARSLRSALPQATFLAFTGTPISQDDRDTQAVFGQYISIYDIQQAVEDGATVPIYYESRLARLAFKDPLLNEVDAQVDELFTEEDDIPAQERAKSRWAALEALVGAQPRIEEVAADLVAHFEQRSRSQPGKAMGVLMSRDICARLYDAIVALRPDWHDDDHRKGVIKVVMTAAASDRAHLQPHHTSKQQKKDLEKRFKDPTDPLKIVLVRDMWLTGFDAPCLCTLYVDKPMRGENLAQAIARVNRVFQDKPGGLVVDYIGIAPQLKEALATYTAANGKGRPTIDSHAAFDLLNTKTSSRRQACRSPTSASSPRSSWRTSPSCPRRIWRWNCSSACSEMRSRPASKSTA